MLVREKSIYENESKKGNAQAGNTFTQNHPKKLKNNFIYFVYLF